MMKINYLTAIIRIFFATTPVLMVQKVTSGFLEVGNEELYYETAGEGENTVLIYDGLVHSEIWDSQLSISQEITE